MDKKCSTCALYIADKSGCARTQTIENPENCCSHWIEEVPTCSVCHRPFVPPATYYQQGDEYITLCPNCTNSRYSCKLCNHIGYCDFKENPIDLPQMINQTVRQGNATMTMQIPNPERVKATCIANCKCYIQDENGAGMCCRQCGTCGNYCMIGENKGE